MKGADHYYCPTEPFRGLFLEISLSIPLFIILQLLLLCNTLYYEYKRSKKTCTSNSNLSLRILFIMLQICGLYWTFIDLFRFIIDPNLFILRNNIGCGLVAHSPKIIPLIYYAIYLYIILLRLKLSFADTSLAINKSTFVILFSILFIPLISIFILFYLFSQPYCIWKWTPPDINNWTLTFCDVNTIGNMSLLIAVGIIWVVVVNIIFGAIICMKLKKFLAKMDNHNDQELAFKLKSLKIRNCILTLIASITTLFSWLCWLTLGNILPFNITFVLYFDVWFNAFVLSLIFKYNDYYYKKLCKYCIIYCFQICDKAYEYESEKISNYIKHIEISNTNLTKTSSQHNTTTSESSSNDNEATISSIQITQTF